MDRGLIIILSICAAGLFAVLLSSRMRRDTGTTSSIADDALNYGRGNVALSAREAEKTGLSIITVSMLTAIAFAITACGVVALYYHSTPGFTFLGAGLLAVGSVTLTRYILSLQNAFSSKTSWVMLVNKKNSPKFWLVYIVLMAAGLILFTWGLILEIQEYKELTLWQASLRVLIPGVLISLLTYWRMRKEASK